jgi:DNA-binding GntR family transcriptional regulator
MTIDESQFIERRLRPAASSDNDQKQAEIVRTLEEDIIFGRVDPGTRLVEDVLIVRFSATRHLIRQALLSLERMGVVTRSKNKGASVRSLTVPEVHQIYDVRELLQRQAAMKIKLPAPRSFIRALEEIQARYCAYIEEDNLRGVHETNDMFHLALFSGCGNPYLVQSIKDYMGLCLPLRAMTVANKAKEAEARRHHDLMIAMLSGNDNWVLAQLCADHIQPSKKAYLERMAERSNTQPGLSPRP